MVKIDTLVDLLQKLLKLVQEEASILRQTAQEGRQIGKNFESAREFADRLEARIPQMLADTQDSTQPDFILKARNWGANFGSIYRMVDAVYAGSQYEPIREQKESAIYETASALYRATL